MATFTRGDIDEAPAEINHKLKERDIMFINIGKRGA
jgi:hypothetical protein